MLNFFIKRLLKKKKFVYLHKISKTKGTKANKSRNCSRDKCRFRTKYLQLHFRNHKQNLFLHCCATNFDSEPKLHCAHRYGTTPLKYLYVHFKRIRCNARGRIASNCKRPGH